MGLCRSTALVGEAGSLAAVTARRKFGSHASSADLPAPPPAQRRRQRGQSLVEFALVVPLFFLLIFGAIDLGRLFYIQMTLQNAVRQAGRYAVTGNHLPDPRNPGQNLSRVASITQAARQAAVGLDISSIQITSLKGGRGNAGGPGDTVTISLGTNLRLITPLIARFFSNGTYRFTVSVSFKNEPFPPGNTL